MGHEGIILVKPPITTFQQSLTHSALICEHNVTVKTRSGDEVLASWSIGPLVSKKPSQEDGNLHGEHDGDC